MEERSPFPVAGVRFLHARAMALIAYLLDDCVSSPALRKHLMRRFLLILLRLPEMC